MESAHKGLDSCAVIDSISYAIRVTNTLNHPILIKIAIKSVV